MDGRDAILPQYIHTYASYTVQRRSLRSARGRPPSVKGGTPQTDSVIATYW